MTPLEQLDKWVDGESLCPNDRDECCPDFSCCSNVETPRGVKEAFRAAFLRGDHEAMEKFCIGFLGGAVLQVSDKEVYLTGAPREEN
jgi:hypothetical protein